MAAVIMAGLAAVLILLGGIAAAVDVEAIVQRNEGAVVVILGEKTGTDAPVQSSGCFVDASGLLLTTAHQVRDVKSLRAKLLDGRQCKLSVVDVDKGREIALLKSDVPPKHVAQLGDAATLKSGSPLVAIAAPENLDFTTVDGIVSSTNRTYQGHPVIQIKLPASPGSSGGPVFDQHGLLVGIVIGRIEDQDWVTIMNPVNNAYAMLERHGVKVPSRDRVAAPPEAEEEIIPAKGVTGLELQALEAYNRGVAAQTPADKVAAYLGAVKLLPAFFEAWFNLAVTYAAADDLPNAEAAYKNAAKVKPNSVAVHRNLGRVFLRQQRPADAIACFDHAVKLAAGDPAVQNDLGEALRQAQQFDKAEQTLLAALKTKPDYAAARFNLALTYAAAGRSADAVDSFKKYLELVPNAPDADEVKDWIRKLEPEKK